MLRFGTHLDITEERAKVINDTLWEVVGQHPYTHVTGTTP
jgi:hypothetical protein